jgi:hypothetical protein
LVLFRVRSYRSYPTPFSGIFGIFLPPVAGVDYSGVARQDRFADRVSCHFPAPGAMVLALATETDASLTEARAFLIGQVS